jgi:hypothetical protein
MAASNVVRQAGQGAEACTPDGPPTTQSSPAGRSSACVIWYEMATKNSPLGMQSPTSIQP